MRLSRTSALIGLSESLWNECIIIVINKREEQYTYNIFGLSITERLTLTSHCHAAIKHTHLAYRHTVILETTLASQTAAESQGAGGGVRAHVCANSMDTNTVFIYY